MKTKVQKWGNSLAIRIPQQIARKYSFENGSEVTFYEADEGIMIKPAESKPTLEELLAQCKPENRHEEIDWGKPEGDEIW